MDDLVQYQILEKLGEALYYHAAKVAEAEEASEAVDYLAAMGVFTDAPKA